MEKVALITGANQGLGLEIARQLGQAGVVVVLGARDPAKGEHAAATLRAEGLVASSVTLDVTSPSDIARLPSFFTTRYGRLDILVNNAGILLDTPETTSVEALRATFETNVVAPFAITEVLLPLLRSAPAGRIVNHSSRLGSLAANASGQTADCLRPAYNSSKAALNMLTIIWARQLANTAIKVNAAHPGWVRTAMGTDAASSDVIEGARTAVLLALLPADGPTGGFYHLEENLPW